MESILSSSYNVECSSGGEEWGLLERNERELEDIRREWEASCHVLHFVRALYVNWNCSMV